MLLPLCLRSCLRAWFWRVPTELWNHLTSRLSPKPVNQNGHESQASSFALFFSNFLINVLLFMLSQVSQVPPSLPSYCSSSLYMFLTDLETRAGHLLFVSRLLAPLWNFTTIPLGALLALCCKGFMKQSVVNCCPGSHGTLSKFCVQLLSEKDPLASFVLYALSPCSLRINTSHRQGTEPWISFNAFLSSFLPVGK